MPQDTFRRIYYPFIAYLRELFYIALCNVPFSSCKRKVSKNTIVALTSFPARINDTWITIESILRQTVKPEKVILTLSASEFPNRVLPRKLRRQEKRGLHVIWIEENTLSYKKLIPAVCQNKGATLITIDDDVIYKPWMVETLLSASRLMPHAVIGYRGWELKLDAQGQLVPYMQLTPATLETSEKATLLTGVGAILYPPDSLDLQLLCDLNTARSICPTADDIWFWAVTRKSNISIRCLGLESYYNRRFRKKSPALEDINRAGGANDSQLKSAIRHFRLSLS